LEPLNEEEYTDENHAMNQLIIAATSAAVSPSTDSTSLSLLVSSNPPPLTSDRRVLTDITNLIDPHASNHHNNDKNDIRSPLEETTNTIHAAKRRRLSITIKEKIKTVQEVRQKVAEGKTISDAVHSITFPVPIKQFSSFKSICEQRLNSPKAERLALTRKRRNGGGRKPILNSDQDKKLFDWLMGLRRGESKVRVTVKHLREKAEKEFGREIEGYKREFGEEIKGFTASGKWVKRWMKRMRLAVRLRTTVKDVSSEEIKKKAEEFKASIKETFIKYKYLKIWNCDETRVYLDAPGNKTIDLIDSPSVEIGTTKHEKYGISVLLCVSCDGDKMDALVVHRSKDKKKMNKIEEKDVIYDHGKVMRMYVSCNPTAYMNGELMTEWIKVIYNKQSHTDIHENTVQSLGYNSVLVMDNCPSHITDEVQECLKECEVYVEFLPANTTPLLQPLDHSLNAMFKRIYEEEWRNWYLEESGKKRTRKGNRKKADQDTINGWIAASLSKMRAENIQRSWEHTLNAQTVLKEAK
ncbi:MAG TPA: hypothetical protein VHA52_04795, partial [Candidatus Babeliaceae bacterium]|nr:hypothetical protein [Candidatus Babeliaceae bacterium]